MNNAIVLCLTVMVTWGLAPQFGRLSGVNAMMMTVLISLGTLATTLPVAFSQNYAAAGSKALSLAFVGGILNGIGLLAFYALVAGSNKGFWELSRVLPIAMVLVPIGITVAARFFFNEPITLQKCIGLTFACFAVWFLK